MFLRRIQVPNFRVLKDVDITFEAEFSPHIFPLGSLNGGGKSTLLQLIFIFLNCSGDPKKHIFIQNMLDGFTMSTESNQTFLSIELTDTNKKNIKLDFFAYTNDSIYKFLNHINSSNLLKKSENQKHLNFSTFDELKSLNEKISNLELEEEVLTKSFNKLDKIKAIEDQNLRSIRVLEEIEVLGKYKEKLKSLNGKQKYRMKLIPRKYYQNISSIEELQEDIQENIEIAKINIETAYKKHELLNNSSDEIVKYIESKKLIYICNFINSSENKEALLCQIHDMNLSDAKLFLEEISNQIFLAAPSTQIFLFLAKKSRQLLFKHQESDNSYDLEMKSSKSQLLNLFTYDFLSVDILIESFKSARDQDFQEKIKFGKYGDYFQNLLNEINSLLTNKKIELDSDLSGVKFKTEQNGEAKELDPEDLSHGELKRLSIYMWLKYRNIENSIVLIDEIENAFHPDWQYQIVSDLYEWGASNQYILATHSYELCQALTPAHIKELEPKLLAEKQVEN